MFLLFTKLKLSFLQKLKKLGFLKRNFKELFKNHGSSVIKEFFKKQGILKPGNFRTFKKHILDLLKTQPFKNNVPGNKYIKYMFLLKMF